MINVLGFRPPEDEGEVVSPVRADAVSLSAIPICNGFNLRFARSRPGRGSLVHNHETNTIYITISGPWRCEWNEGKALEHVDAIRWDSDTENSLDMDFVPVDPDWEALDHQLDDN